MIISRRLISDLASPKKRKRFPKNFAAVGLDVVSVTNDDAVEIPIKDMVDGRANGGAIFHHAFGEAARAKPIQTTIEFHDECEQPVRVVAEAEGEICDQEAATRSMKKNHFVQAWHAAHEMLVDDFGPGRMRSIGQRRGNEPDVFARFSESRSTVKFRFWIFGLKLAQTFVVETVWAHDEPNVADSRHFLAEFPRPRNGRVNPNSAGWQTYDYQLPADPEAHRAVGHAKDEKIAVEGSKHRIA
jgi:hypothetical protein